MNLPKKKLHILIAVVAVFLGTLVIIFGSMLLDSDSLHSDEKKNTEKTSEESLVKDTTAPVISLVGEERAIISFGSEYVDAGYTATDDADGDITASVVVEGTVDTRVFGEYTLTYTAKDSSGNIATIQRIVVVQTQSDEQAANPPGKVIYLTFDDGPGPYTQQLLDILDKYNVDVTFFVTNQTSSCQDLIGEAFRRGHTIAMHTYSHRFPNIYASETAYFNDLNKIQAICEAQTGVTPKIVRFPGGTGNGVSKEYCSGIMTTLTKSLTAKGYLYCDWNVDSDDAGNAKTPEEVFNNVIAGIQKRKTAVVLQHDTYLYSVEAVENIIRWGLENGYTFLPMTEESPMIHQKPIN